MNDMREAMNEPAPTIAAQQPKKTLGGAKKQENADEWGDDMDVAGLL